MDGDELIRGLLQAMPGDDMASANLLLNEIFNGFPISKVAALLESDNDRAAAEGAWILAECGVSAREFLPYVPTLAVHRSHAVRFWVPDFVLLAATEQDGAIVCDVLRLLDDSNDAVRWNAIRQLAKLPENVRLNALRAANSTPDLNKYSDAIRFMQVADEDAIETAIRSVDKRTRSAAAIAMIRNLPSDLATKGLAASSTDRAIRNVALGEWQEECE